MQKVLRPSSVIPPGFTIVSSSIADGGATILVRSTLPTSQCPRCGTVSGRVHSRYRHQISDLPLTGRPVKLMADARRLRCEAVRCGQRIFAEQRFADGAVAPWARRTGRLETLVHHLGLALGGRPAASFARRLMPSASNDTLLRVVRRRGCASFPAPTVIGIDDWAWRRNQRYGAVICDLERRRPIRLLPDREPATAQAWLAEQPQVAIIARDRGGAYARAAAKALPNAVQVADRWHLMENASRAFLDAVRRSVRQIRSAVGAMTIKPDLLTAAEQLQYEGRLHREETNAVIRRKVGADLDPWMARAHGSLVASFANGVAKDIAAVRAAIASQWSNGQTEGQITKLKLVKRQMYGRGKLDLLQARLIGAT